MVVAFSLVLLSGLIHAIWNLFAKRSINKSVFLWYCQLVAVILYLPFMLPEAIGMGSLPLKGILLMALSMVLHGGYVVLLAKTYSAGDLSLAYPIMRGVGPILVPLASVWLLHESMKPIGWIGVATIVCGIVLMGKYDSRSTQPRPTSAILLALGVGLFITSYTLIDKQALHYVPPLTLNEAANFGNFIALSWVALRSRELRSEWNINWRTILLGGILAPGGYVLFLYAMTHMQVAQLAPMREIGTVFGTILGVWILRETQGKKRIIASVLITLGIVLLAQ